MLVNIDLSGVFLLSNAGAERHAPVTDETHRDALRQAFDNEDAPMLEAVQRNMGDVDFWEMRPAILALDAGAIRARRIIRRRLKGETRHKGRSLD